MLSAGQGLDLSKPLGIRGLFDKLGDLGPWYCLLPDAKSQCHHLSDESSGAATFSLRRGTSALLKACVQTLLGVNAR
jgi:hypothetical protein